MELKDYTTEELRAELKRRNAEENYTPDYWTRLEHQYAGMVMLGMCTNPQEYYQYTWKEMADYAADAAHVLVKRYKKEEQL